jgi:lipoate---protein ligase
MHFLDLTLPTPEENLALDEALLLDAEDGHGGEVLRLWEGHRLAVVLGSGGKLAEDVDDGACGADGVPILRRSSGGGTVLLGTGCLCFSVVLAFGRDPILEDLHGSYAYILRRVIDALPTPGIDLAGICDLALGGKKFSGNAQQRKRHHLLHHGTILYGFDLSLVPRYLREPPRRPDYRGRREHDAFIRNLDVGRDDLIAALRRAWEPTTVTTEWPRDRVAHLVRERYSLAAWSRRR